MAMNGFKRKRKEGPESTVVHKRARKQPVEEPSSESEQSAVEDEPAVAQFIGESDMEDELSASEDDAGGLGGLKNALGSLPLGALLKAQKKLAPPVQQDLSDEEEAPSRRIRPGKTGRAEPRRSSAIAGSSNPDKAVSAPSRENRPEKRVKPHRESKHACVRSTTSTDCAGLAR